MKLRLKVIAANGFSFTCKLRRGDGSKMFSVLTLPNKVMRVKTGDMVLLTIEKLSNGTEKKST